MEPSQFLIRKKRVFSVCFSIDHGVPTLQPGNGKSHGAGPGNPQKFRTPVRPYFVTTDMYWQKIWGLYLGYIIWVYLGYIWLYHPNYKLLKLTSPHTIQESHTSQIHQWIQRRFRAVPRTCDRFSLVFPDLSRTRPRAAWHGRPNHYKWAMFYSKPISSQRV